MLTNVIDRRTRPYRFKKINAVIEPTRHDNGCQNADIAPRDLEMDGSWMGYAQKEHVTLSDAVVWATSHKDAVTLYLYDEDGGIYPRRCQ